MGSGQINILLVMSNGKFVYLMKFAKKRSILTEIQTPDLCHKRLFSPR